MSPGDEKFHRSLSPLLAFPDRNDGADNGDGGDGGGQQPGVEPCDATLRRRHNLPRDVRDTRRDARQIRRNSHGDKEPSHTNCAPRTVRAFGGRRRSSSTAIRRSDCVSAPPVSSVAGPHRLPNVRTRGFTVLDGASSTWLAILDVRDEPSPDKHFRST